MSDVVILSSASEFFVYFVFASRVILSIHLFFGLRVDQFIHYLSSSLSCCVHVTLPLSVFE